MSDSVASHPHRELMAEAQREREVADSPEGTALQDAITRALIAYADFLERTGLIWDESYDLPRQKARALVGTYDYDNGGAISIKLKDGSLDRVYGNGTNPDFARRGPTDIPHKPRDYD